MSKSLLTLGFLLLGAIALTGNTTLISSPAAPANPPPAPDGVSVLNRGPVHEAFAKPTPANAEPGSVVPKQPPAPVPELPPDQKPEGKDVQWIPGYWSYDLEKKDFIWVSGVWRVPPPGMRWVPGYWNQAADGWQWVNGFWNPVARAEVPYQPQPPGSLDSGPNMPAPDDSSSWVPGNWVYRDNRYLWRPGFWNRNRANWIWNQASYSWTPAGYTYQDGYWDYPLEDRGTLFAPVTIDPSLLSAPDWSYTPSYCVNPVGLLDSLFFGPNCGYYFGNYYSPFWGGCGFTPWCFAGPGCFDPLFGHAFWGNRFNRDWLGNQRGLARDRFNNGRFNGNHLVGRFNGENRFNGGNRGGLAHLSANERELQRQGARQFHEISANRGRLESASANGARGSHTALNGNGGLSLPRQAGVASPSEFQGPRQSLAGHGSSGQSFPTAGPSHSTGTPTISRATSPFTSSQFGSPGQSFRGPSSPSQSFRGMSSPNFSPASARGAATSMGHPAASSNFSRATPNFSGSAAHQRAISHATPSRPTFRSQPSGHSSGGHSSGGHSSGGHSSGGHSSGGHSSGGHGGHH